MTEDRTSAALVRLRRALQLLEESIISYERNGTRTKDKLHSDCRLMITSCFDVGVELARKGE